MSQLDELRTDKASGIIVGCVGLLMVGFALFGLAIVQLQSLMLSSMPPIPVDANGSDMAKMMRNMHGVWLTYMPFTFAGGVIFGVCGWRICGGSVAARRVAQVNAALGYVWGIAYSFSCSQYVDRFAIVGMKLDDSTVEKLRVASLIMSIAMMTVVPTALLFLLSRPKDKTIDAIVC